VVWNLWLQSSNLEMKVNFSFFDWRVYGIEVEMNWIDFVVKEHSISMSSRESLMGTQAFCHVGCNLILQARLALASHREVLMGISSDLLRGPWIKCLLIPILSPSQCKLIPSRLVLCPDVCVYLDKYIYIYLSSSTHLYFGGTGVWTQYFTHALSNLGLFFLNIFSV
jgi:hypothetical protein